MADREKSNGQALWYASESGNVDKVRELLKAKDVDIDYKNRNYNGETSLMKASRWGYVEIVRCLIDAQASLDLQNSGGWTALMDASITNHIEVVKCLIAANASIDLQSKNGTTALMYGAELNNVEIVRCLIEAKASTDLQASNGDTALHMAMEKKYTALCKLLIEEGKANVSIKDNDGNTPLDLWRKSEKREDRRKIEKSIKDANRRALMEKGSKPVSTIKLFLFGGPMKGKTTLKESLSQGLFGYIADSKTSIPENERTVGIKVEEKQIRGAGPFMVWDTAGQTEFRVTHAMLMGTNLGIFIIAYDSTDLESKQQKELKYWLSFIKTGHDPVSESKPIVVLVGTHLDQLKNPDQVSRRLKKNIADLKRLFGDDIMLHDECILLDCRKARSRGMKQLKDTLAKLAEPLREEIIPKICDEIIKKLSSWCKAEAPLLQFSEFVEKVRSEIDRLAEDELLTKAVGYLHDMGQVHHAKLAGKGDIIIVNPDWLTTTIFGPLFAPPSLGGLEPQPEYTLSDLKTNIHLDDADLLIRLLEHFELAYRNESPDKSTFIIPAKLPHDTEEIGWEYEDPAYGKRIECRDETDMLSVDTFPCLQVSSMNRFGEKGVKPQLSLFGLKVVRYVQGMIQLTHDKRAIHIAVRAIDGKETQARRQLDEMEAMVFDQISERSRGTNANVQYLSPLDLRKNKNLEDNVSYYSEELVMKAEKSNDNLFNPKTMEMETVSSVTGPKQSSLDVLAISDDELRQVIKLLGPDQLQELYQCLEIPQQDIRKAECNTGKFRNVDGEAMAVLQHWRKETGSNATKEAILNALDNLRYKDVREKLEHQWGLGGAAVRDAPTQPSTDTYQVNAGKGDLALPSQEQDVVVSSPVPHGLQATQPSAPMPTRTRPDNTGRDDIDSNVSVMSSTTEQAAVGQGGQDEQVDIGQEYQAEQAGIGQGSQAEQAAVGQGDQAEQADVGQGDQAEQAGIRQGSQAEQAAIGQGGQARQAQQQAAIASPAEPLDPQPTGLRSTAQQSQQQAAEAIDLEPSGLKSPGFQSTRLKSSRMQLDPGGYVIDSNAPVVHSIAEQAALRQGDHARQTREQTAIPTPSERPGSRPKRPQSPRPQLAISDKDIQTIAFDINLGPGEFHQVYKRLGLVNAAVKSAELATESEDPSHRASGVLRYWRQINGDHASRDKVLDALKKAELNDALDKLLRYWSI